MPDRATLFEGVGELFTSVRVPEKVPAVVGAKLTVKGEEPPGGILIGIVRPEKAKVVPESDACVMDRLAVPGLDMVSVCVPVAPVLTLPKLAEAGEREICGWTPVPLRVMVVGEFVALLITLRLPVALPIAEGMKLTPSARL